EPLNSSTFDLSDYRLHLDGRPRKDGIRAFLASRGMRLPEGSDIEIAGFASVSALAAEKDIYFRKELQGGVKVYPTTVDLIHQLRAAGIEIGVVSSSRHCRDVLDVTGLTPLFAARVDGNDVSALGLPGKPDP